MRRAAVVLLVASALAPAAFRTPPVPEIADETLRAARFRGFPYRLAWQKAADGDRAALVELLEFSRWTDAAGSLGHGVALTELADRVGDASMAEAVAGLDAGGRILARRMLEAGVAYRAERQDPSRTPGLYPLSWAAASSSSP